MFCSNSTQCGYVHSDSLWVVVPHNYELVKNGKKQESLPEHLRNAQSELLLPSTLKRQFNAGIGHLRQWFICNISSPHSEPMRMYYYPILQLRKLRPREAKFIAQLYTHQ